jgi:hypothetical protein
VRFNPVAALIVVIAAVGLIVAVRGTQDNLLSAIAGRPVLGASDQAGNTADGFNERQSKEAIDHLLGNGLSTTSNTGTPQVPTTLVP